MRFHPLGVVLGDAFAGVLELAVAFTAFAARDLKRLAHDLSFFKSRHRRVHGSNDIGIWIWQLHEK